MGPLPTGHAPPNSNGFGSKLLMGRRKSGGGGSNSNMSSGMSRCFLVALSFAALGLVLNFMFLLRLEENRKLTLLASRLASQRRLAVVVPAHRGDLDRALASLSRWPSACSEVTLSSVDLILYYAGDVDEKSSQILPSLSYTGGRCFSNTQVVYANLTAEVREEGCACSILLLGSKLTGHVFPALQYTWDRW